MSSCGPCADLTPTGSFTVRQLRDGGIQVTPVMGAQRLGTGSAASMAKRAGVTTGMAIAAARRRWPGIALVPQQPDLYC